MIDKNDIFMLVSYYINLSHFNLIINRALLNAEKVITQLDSLKRNIKFFLNMLKVWTFFKQKVFYLIRLCESKIFYQLIIKIICEASKKTANIN